MARRALITGIFGQDGAYLSKLLLEKGYEVWGSYNQESTKENWRLQALGLDHEVRLLELDLLQRDSIPAILDRVRPDEVYNFAAQSVVGASFESPLLTTDINAVGVACLLEALRKVGGPVRYYQASTSEMFGHPEETPQRETTRFHPRSPYGVAKVFAHHLTVNYRETYGMHLTSGILFNHESPLRGPEFVTRKITTGLASLALEAREPLKLGNLDARRDWGFAGDYVRGMWMMLQQDHADDYVLASGVTHSVREFTELAARAVGFDLVWDGVGVNSRGRDRKSGRVLIEVSPEFFRPAEVDQLVGDPTKARQTLRWKPEVSFAQLVTLMAEADLERARQSR